MGLEDKIEEEMVVDASNILEDEFERANEVIQILQDGSVKLERDYRDISTEKTILAYLIGKQYSYKSDRIENPSVSYEYFYDLISVDDSTIRHKMTDLEEENLVQKNEETSEWSIVVDSIDLALDRVISQNGSTK